jgi:vacuolar protein sorting-associated protein 13D
MSMDPSTSDYDFILQPVSATASVKRNCSERPLSSKKIPRMTCDLQLSSIPVEISERQYQCAIVGARTLHQVNNKD